MNSAKFFYISFKNNFKTMPGVIALLIGIISFVFLFAAFLLRVLLNDMMGMDASHFSQPTQHTLDFTYRPGTSYQTVRQIMEDYSVSSINCKLYFNYELSGAQETVSLSFGDDAYFPEEQVASNERAMVLTETAAQQIDRKNGTELQVGEQIELFGDRYTVIGIVPPLEDSFKYFSICIPYRDDLRVENYQSSGSAWSTLTLTFSGMLLNTKHIERALGMPLDGMPNWTLIVFGVCTAALLILANCNVLYVYRYYLKKSEQRVMTYRMLGARRCHLVGAMAVECGFILIAAILLGAAGDSIIRSIFPMMGGSFYLNWLLFAGACAVAALVPVAALYLVLFRWLKDPAKRGRGGKR